MANLNNEQKNKRFLYPQYSIVIRVHSLLLPSCSPILLPSFSPSTFFPFNSQIPIFSLPLFPSLFLSSLLFYSLPPSLRFPFPTIPFSPHPPTQILTSVHRRTLVVSKAVSIKLVPTSVTALLDTREQMQHTVVSYLYMSTLKLPQWIPFSFSCIVIRRCEIKNGDCQHDCFYDVDGVGRCKCRNGRVMDPARERKCWGMVCHVHSQLISIGFCQVLKVSSLGYACTL